jgi:CheY-like chemotaxis protein
MLVKSNLPGKARAMVTQPENNHDSSGSFLRPVKALLLDDSAFDRTRIRRMAEKGALPIEFSETTSIGGLSGEMDRDVFDLILIDFQLPEGNGLQALEIVQNHPTNRNATKIMITGQQRTDIAIPAFRQGCHDFISKDELSVSLLKRALHGSIHQMEATQSRAYLFANEMQNQIQTAVLDALGTGQVQSALEKHLRKAAQDIGLAVNETSKSESTQALVFEFLKDDTTGFDFLTNSK